MEKENLETLQNEIWRKHPIGVYGSSKGRCYIPKSGSRSAHYTFGSNNNTTSYKQIKWKGKNYQVHRLIAELFISNPNNYPTVDHINRNRSDNRIENLRWATRSMQLYNRDTSNFKNNALSKQVAQIDPSTNEIIRIWESISECDRNGYHQSAVSKCCKNKFHRIGNNIYKGYKWQYLEKAS